MVCATPDALPCRCFGSAKRGGGAGAGERARDCMGARELRRVAHVRAGLNGAQGSLRGRGEA